jgi:hypothetical protein
VTVRFHPSPSPVIPQTRAGRGVAPSRVGLCRQRRASARRSPFLNAFGPDHAMVGIRRRTRRPRGTLLHHPQVGLAKMKKRLTAHLSSALRQGLFNYRYGLSTTIRRVGPIQRVAVADDADRAGRRTWRTRRRSPAGLNHPLTTSCQAGCHGGNPSRPPGGSRGLFSTIRDPVKKRLTIG